MPLRRVLDATAFFLEIPIDGELFTTPLIVDELADMKSRCRFEALSAAGMRVVPPGREFLHQVEEASTGSGDEGVLSAADLELLALAVEISGEVVSDDFALQNVAHHLGLHVCPLQQRRARKRTWKFRCPGCGRYAEGPEECPICGAMPKRTIK